MKGRMPVKEIVEDRRSYKLTENGYMRGLFLLVHPAKITTGGMVYTPAPPPTFNS